VDVGVVRVFSLGGGGREEEEAEELMIVSGCCLRVKTGSVTANLENGYF
jgi:hypothetical protein